MTIRILSSTGPFSNILPPLSDHFRSTALLSASPSIPAALTGLDLVVEPYVVVDPDVVVVDPDVVGLASFLLLGVTDGTEGTTTFLGKGEVRDFGVIWEVMVSRLKGSLGTDKGLSVSTESLSSAGCGSSLTSNGYSF